MKTLKSYTRYLIFALAALVVEGFCLALFATEQQMVFRPINLIPPLFCLVLVMVQTLYHHLDIPIRKSGLLFCILILAIISSAVFEMWAWFALFTILFLQLSVEVSECMWKPIPLVIRSLCTVIMSVGIIIFCLPNLVGPNLFVRNSFPLALSNLLLLYASMQVSIKPQSPDQILLVKTVVQVLFGMCNTVPFLSLEILVLELVLVLLQYCLICSADKGKQVTT